MDIYTRKTSLKLILLLLGSAIGLTTIAYTNYLTNRIAEEEKNKARLWADAIEKRAQLLRYTYELFGRLSADERDKVKVWAQSTRFILTVDDNELLTFFNDIIIGNIDIPVILVTDKSKIISARNVSFEGIEDSVFFRGKLREEFSDYPPIVVQSLDEGSKNFIYYKDSNLFQELKNTLNDLIEKFIYEVVVNTTIAPVVMVDDKMNLVAFGNLDTTDVNTRPMLEQTINNMIGAHDPIIVDFGDNELKFIYYDDSTILKQLKIFPIVQLAIFVFFLFVSYMAFSNARKAEQNLVWVGMAKETAHQLGTPISSLSAWVEYLKETGEFNAKHHVIAEIEHDISRLSLVAERFSKIGSVPKLKPHNVLTVLKENVNYMKNRASEKMIFTTEVANEKLEFLINRELFDWVMENLLKNALDAMDGVGSIHVKAFAETKRVVIEVADSGKGIPRNKFSTVFEPGYSTKQRGWGLGLSLTKRIVENYHSGKIFVKSSTPQGTVFRVELLAA
jgi:nitrogen-specific signal transduction histidine kinase